MGTGAGLRVFVATGDWGGARIEDIRAIAKDVVEQFCEYFTDLSYLGSGHVIIQKCPDGVDGVPRTIFREELNDPFFINLNTSGTVWAKVAYQFAHELCHVLSGHDRLRKPANQWFIESVCELASVFCVFQMSKSWETAPPYWNWKDYAPHLASYGQEFLDRPVHKLPDEPNLVNWLKDNISRLTANPYLRELNAIVAIKLLPLVQVDPKRWESIAFLPDTDEPFEVFLVKWRLAVCNGSA